MKTIEVNNSTKAARELQVIANAYAMVYENRNIALDMSVYGDVIISEAKAMKKENFKYSYTTILYVRSRGVERSIDRVQELHDTLLAVVTIRFDKDTQYYTITKQNMN